jgi:SAM-dependent methyltransferase
VSDEIGLYEDAEVYDILHWPGTAEEFRGLEAAGRAFARTRTRGVWTVLEPACGTGRLLRAAARRGYRPIGFDLSPVMVAYSAEKLERSGLRGKAIVADMVEFADAVGERTVDFAFCPINTIRHLESDAAMLAHFEQMRRVLKPGGVYLVGIGTSMAGLEIPTEDVWEGSRGRVRVKQVISFVPPMRGRYEEAHSHLIISRAGKVIDHRDSSYRLRTYSLRQWERLVARSALRTLAVVDDEGEEIDPPELGYGVWVLAER